MHNYIDGNSMKAIERRSKTLRERTTTSEAMMILHSTGELFSLVTTYVAQLNHMNQQVSQQHPSPRHCL